MADPRIEIAAFNNAFWCDAVCDAQGSPGEFRDDLWLNRHVTPRFYPNMVTLTPGAQSAHQLEQVQALLHAGLTGEWTVKDSFASLDLAPLGFEVAFEATWLWRPPMQPGLLVEPDAPVEALRWRVIQSPEELQRWEAAWSGETGGESLPRIFLPDLLEQPGIVFVAAYQALAIVAGVVASRSDDVVGISNVFVPPGREDLCWKGCIHAVEQLFPGLAMVDYEHGEDLLRARAQGFEAIGPLRVWTHTGRTSRT